MSEINWYVSLIIGNIVKPCTERIETMGGLQFSCLRATVAILQWGEFIAEHFSEERAIGADRLVPARGGILRPGLTINSDSLLFGRTRFFGEPRLFPRNEMQLDNAITTLDGLIRQLLEQVLLAC